MGRLLLSGHPRHLKHLKWLGPLAVAFALFIAQAQTALACGGLVAPNGAVRLSRATTLVAWHDGVEHYLTSFTYQGDVANLGWIVAAARRAGQDRRRRRVVLAAPLPRDIRYPRTPSSRAPRQRPARRI